MKELIDREKILEEVKAFFEKRTDNDVREALLYGGLCAVIQSIKPERVCCGGDCHGKEREK